MEHVGVSLYVAALGFFFPLLSSTLFFFFNHSADNLLKFDKLSLFLLAVCVYVCVHVRVCPGNQSMMT